MRRLTDRRSWRSEWKTLRSRGRRGEEDGLFVCKEFVVFSRWRDKMGRQTGRARRRRRRRVKAEVRAEESVQTKPNLHKNHKSTFVEEETQV